jgi:hypothetical protein
VKYLLEMATKKFGWSKPSALTGVELESLTVGGTGLNLTAKLGQMGATTGDPVVTVLVKAQGGKVCGSRWEVRGGLGKVPFNPYRLTGSRGVELTLDLSDLGKFVFPSASSPCAFGNLSEWLDGEMLTSRLKEDTTDTEDMSVIKNHRFFKQDGGGFCLRLAVVPMSKGLTTLWLSAVPGNMDWFKKSLLALNTPETDHLIPTVGIKITPGKGPMGAAAKYIPVEGSGGGTATTRGWGQYPLIQV